MPQDATNLGSRCPKLWRMPWLWTMKWEWPLLEGNTEGIECSEKAFKIVNDDDKPPIHSQYMKFHKLFSIKMEDFFTKAHLVAGCHMIKTPKV